MTRELALSPFLSTSVLSASALARTGSREQNTGTGCRGSHAAKRSSPSRSTRGRATARSRPWRRAPAEAGGSTASSSLCSTARPPTRWVDCRQDGDEVALFLATADAAGLSRDARTLVDGRRVATVTLDGVLVGSDARLEGGAATIEEVVDIGRAVISAALCGVAEEAFARTARYLKERRQFDRRIGSFQELQHRAARALQDRERLVGDASSAKSLEAGTNSAAFDVAIAKAKASETACAATAECLQMHGGIGMTDEFDIGLFLKRARIDWCCSETLRFTPTAWRRCSAIERCGGADVGPPMAE